MSKLRVSCFGGSVDGFGVGPDQGLENPLGVGGMGLHQWVFPSRMFQRMHGGGGDGMTGVRTILPSDPETYFSPKSQATETRRDFANAAAS